MEQQDPNGASRASRDTLSHITEDLLEAHPEAVSGLLVMHAYADVMGEIVTEILHQGSIEWSEKFGVAQLSFAVTNFPVMSTLLEAFFAQAAIGCLCGKPDCKQPERMSDEAIPAIVSNIKAHLVRTQKLLDKFLEIHHDGVAVDVYLEQAASTLVKAHSHG